MTMTSDALAAITSHHAELEASLIARVDGVVAAARTGTSYDAAVRELRDLLDRDIVPHARAEEEVLYAAATAPTLRPLVTGMVLEHETLLGLADDLARASTAVDAAVAAGAIRAVFVGHVRRENELLLPALAADRDVDLPGLLPVMQERFAAHRAGAHT